MRVRLLIVACSRTRNTTNMRRYYTDTDTDADRDEDTNADTATRQTYIGDLIETIHQLIKGIRKRGRQRDLSDMDGTRLLT